MYIYLARKKTLRTFLPSFFWKPSYIKNVWKTLVRIPRQRQEHSKKTCKKRSENVWKTLGVEQPCWAPADGELAWKTRLPSRRGLHGPWIWGVPASDAQYQGTMLCLFCAARTALSHTHTYRYTSVPWVPTPKKTLKKRLKNVKNT